MLARFTLLFFSVIFSLAAEDNSSETLFDKKVVQLMEEFHVPGCSLSIVHLDKIIKAKSYGYADINLKRQVTNTTRFQACSITKTLTSVAVLKVLHHYQISIDSPVNAYLKRWKIPDNVFSREQPVTIRMLLNHTAPFSNPYPDGGYQFNAMLPTLAQQFFGESTANSPPLKLIGMPGQNMPIAMAAMLFCRCLLKISPLFPIHS